MYLVYFIKCKEDFDRMITLHPDINFGHYPTPVFEQFVQGNKLPMAAFVNTETNRLTRGNIAYARNRLRERPDFFTKVDLPNVLSHVQVLRKFLKANRAYSKFKRNVLAATNIGDYTSESTMLIDALNQCSFSWYYTPQGRKYWSDLALKWQALVTHFKLDKEIIGNYHDKL